MLCFHHLIQHQIIWNVILIHSSIRGGQIEDKKMNKKDEQKKSNRILSYIFLVCGTINFLLLFFNGDGFIESFGIIDDIGFSIQWMRLVFSVICLPLGIVLYKNSGK